jgi:NAD(P)-dependent dehydrogenase (short-subunit alcohol dehydrogenase family)
MMVLSGENVLIIPLQETGALMANRSYIEPSEIAAAMAFLASSEASSGTGAAWTIDNGTHA